MRFFSTAIRNAECHCLVFCNGVSAKQAASSVKHHKSQELACFAFDAGHEQGGVRIARRALHRSQLPRLALHRYCDPRWTLNYINLDALVSVIPELIEATAWA